VRLLRRSQDFFELLKEVIPVTTATPAQRAIIGKHASMLVAPGTPGGAGRPGLPDIPGVRRYPGDGTRPPPAVIVLLTSTSTVVLVLTAVAYLLLCSLLTGRVALESPFSAPARLLANSVVWVICTQALLQLALDVLRPYTQQLPPWPVLAHHAIAVARAAYGRARRWLRPPHGVGTRLRRTDRSAEGGGGGDRGDGDAKGGGGESRTGRASRVARETVMSMVREQLGNVRFPDEVGGAEYAVVAEEVQVSCVLPIAALQRWTRYLVVKGD